MAAFTIGKAAQAAGVGVETIRFYEKRGLVIRPELKGGKYREYPPTVVTRIGFIKRAQQLGFTLAEIQDLLRLSDTPDSNRRQVKDLAERKATSIRKKIADLQRMEKTLSRLVRDCSGHGEVAGCPIIEALAGAANTIAT